MRSFSGRAGDHTGAKSCQEVVANMGFENFCLINFQFFLGMISNSPEFLLFINQSLTRRITVAAICFHVFGACLHKKVVAAAYVFVSQL